MLNTKKMIEDNRGPHDIYVQLRSVESAFHSSIMETLDSEHRHELAERLVEELENCPGSCQYCDVIDTLKRDFPKLSLTQVLDGLHHIPVKRNPRLPK